MKNFLKFLCIFSVTFFIFSQNFGMQSPNFRKYEGPTFNPWTLLPFSENLAKEPENPESSLALIPAASASTATVAISTQNKPSIVQHQEQKVLDAQNPSTTPSSSSTTPIKTPINYSLLPKINALFNESNTDEIEEKNAALENWLDDFPTNFRTLINKEIIVATEKYLSKNLNASPDFFIALPYDSLVKTVLCLLFYLKYCTYAEFFEDNRNGIITFISKPLSSLKDAIYLYIKNNYLYEIFNAVKYWSEESPGVVSFIQLTTRITYDYEQESKSNSDPKDKKTLTKYKRKLQRFKTTLGNSINFISAIFKIKIHKLDLFGNNLDSIPQSVFLMNELQELILRKNKIMVVLKDIKNLQKIQTLDIQDNNLQMLPKELSDLPNLKEIDLRGNPSLKYHGPSQETINALIAKGVNVKI